jgi:hypothetical protein
MLSVCCNDEIVMHTFHTRRVKKMGEGGHVCVKTTGGGGHRVKEGGRAFWDFNVNDGSHSTKMAHPGWE